MKRKITLDVTGKLVGSTRSPFLIFKYIQIRKDEILEGSVSDLKCTGKRWSQRCLKTRSAESSDYKQTGKVEDGFEGFVRKGREGYEMTGLKHFSYDC